MLSIYEAKLHFVSVFSKKKQSTDCVFLLHVFKGTNYVSHIFNPNKYTGCSKSTTDHWLKI